MKAIPLELKDANALVDRLHRHHPSVHRDKFRVGCEIDGKLVGVVQLARPVSRMLDDGNTIEVVRRVRGILARRAVPSNAGLKNFSDEVKLMKELNGTDDL